MAANPPTDYLHHQYDHLTVRIDFFSTLNLGAEADFVGGVDTINNGQPHRGSAKTSDVLTSSVTTF